MKKNKIAVHMGDGVLTGKGKLSVTDKDGKKTELSAKHIIVATGARARDLPFAKADGMRGWIYRAAIPPPAMPTNLFVRGRGAREARRGGKGGIDASSDRGWPSIKKK